MSSGVILVQVEGGHMGATGGEKEGDDVIILTSKYENEEPFILTLALMV